MKTIFVKPKPQKKSGYAALQRLKRAKKKRGNRIRLLFSVDLKPKKTCEPYYKFYTVYKNETEVNQVSTNDFKLFRPTYLKIKAACKLNLTDNVAFSIPADNMVYCFVSQIKAMEFAKAGALKYISKLISEGEKSYDVLTAYREAHYEDLNINLTARNISNFALN